MSIFKYVESIFTDIDNFPKEGLSQKEVTHKILKHRNKPINPETEEKEQPNASKALTRLIQENKIFMTAERLYYPITPETAQKEALVDFSQNIYCIKPDIYAVVDTMYLIKVHSDHVWTPPFPTNQLRLQRHFLSASIPVYSLSKAPMLPLC